jgi:hypothetical protein
LVLFVLQWAPISAFSQYLFIEKPQLDILQSAEVREGIEESRKQGDRMQAVPVRVDQSVLMQDFIVVAVLEGGPSFIINKKELVRYADQSFSWLGEGQAKDVTASVSVSGKRLSGTIYVRRERQLTIYTFSSLDDDVVLFRKLASKPALPDHPLGEKLIAPTAEELETDSSPRPNASGPSRVDLLIAYTPAAERLTGFSQEVRCCHPR